MKSKSHSSTRSNRLRRRFAEDILAIINKEKSSASVPAKTYPTASSGSGPSSWMDTFSCARGISKPRSWLRTFLEDPQGIIVVGEKEILIRAIQTRSERLKDLVSAAYREEYNRPGSVQYVEDMAGKKSRDTTMEMVSIQE